MSSDINTPIEPEVQVDDSVKNVETSIPISTPPLVIKTGVRPIVVMLLLLLIAGVFFALGYFLSTFTGDVTPQVTPTPSITGSPEPTITTTVSPSIEEEEWVDYENTQYNFKLSYPEGWYLAQEGDGNGFDIGYGGYILSISILKDRGIGYEKCYYSDTPIEDAYDEFNGGSPAEEFIEIDGIGRTYRAAFSENDWSFDLCAKSDDGSDFFNNVFNGVPYSVTHGVAHYRIPTTDVSDGMLDKLYGVIASLDGLSDQ